MAKAMTLGWAARIKELDRIERQKDYPARFPVNSDSIGIEILDHLYEPLELGSGDVFRHPEVSYKNPGEAASAQWR